MRNLALFIPLGLLGVLRWASWLIRRIPAVLYKPYARGHSEPMTVVTPVYQEDPEIFREAIKSWLANDIRGVVAVIDVTDTVCKKVAEEFGDKVDIIITDVPGKRDALRLGWERARTPLVALVDSDTLWAEDVALRVGEPFADPSVGGVGTRQNVFNPTTVWQKLNDIYLDFRYSDEVAGQSHWGRAVSCLSGRTAVYRRDILLEISDDFMNEKFMGVQANSGEDKRLTTLTLERGYRHYLQQNARVWSTFPPDASTFFKQRLRWARNTWRSDLRALFGGWIFRHKFLAFTLIDKALSVFTLLVSPIYLGIAIASGQWFVVALLVMWWLISRTAKYFPHLVRRPRDVTLMPVVIVMSFVLAIVKICALLTIRKQKWLTRDVAVIGNQIVRTSGPDVSGAIAMARHDHDGEDVVQPKVEHPGSISERVRFRPPILGAGIVTALVLGAGTVVPMVRVADDRCLLPDGGFAAVQPREGGRSPDSWVASRVTATGCEWEPDVRAIVLDTDKITLQAGGKIVRSIAFSTNERVGFEELKGVINDDAWIHETEPTVFELKATLYQQPGTQLLVSRPNVTELRLLDAPYLYMGGAGAEAVFSNVDVHSWTGSDVDVNHEDGRPFLLYEDGSTLDIHGPDSVFRSLGSDRSGAYGVSWSGPGTRGLAEDTTFSQNFFGAFSSDVAELTLRGNSFRDNVWYGISPHVKGTLLLARNDAYRNGSHGIDLSRGVTASTLDTNHSYENDGHGISLRQASNANVLKNNTIELNARDGIVVHGSASNRLVSNEIRLNGGAGVRISGKGAIQNVVITNTITGNESGVSVYGGAKSVELEANEILETASVAVRLDGEGSRSVNDKIDNANVGFDIRSSATIELADVDHVSVGVVVRGENSVTIDEPKIQAGQIAIRVDRGASAKLTGGQISAPIPIKGSEVLPVGLHTQINTSPPPGLPLFGALGVFFLIAAIGLEFVRRRGVRVRGDNDMSVPPDVVWNTAT